MIRPNRTQLTFLACGIALMAAIQGGSALATDRPITSLRMRPAETVRIDGSNRWFHEKASGGHSLRLLPTGADSFAERYRVLEAAESSIYISSYILRDDGEHSLLADTLCRKAEQGLDVRIIADSYGSNFRQRSPGKHLAPYLRDCGVAVIFFAPIEWGFGATFHAMHDKMILVDGKQGVFGGMAFGSVYRTAARDNPKWHDLDIAVAGPLVCHLQKRYEEIWWKSAAADVITNPEGKAKPYLAYGNPDFVGCTPTRAQGGKSRAFGVLWNAYFEKNAPGKKRPLNDVYLDAIRNTRDGGRVDLWAPYFIPHPKLVSALIAARKRHVQVNVITNSPDSTDESDITVVGMLTSVKKLLRAGVRIHMWGNRATMHRKAALFDGRWGYVGSDNFDRRAQEYNSESAIFTDDEQLVSELAREYELDLARTYELKLEDIRGELGKQGWLIKQVTRRVLPIL